MYDIHAQSMALRKLTKVVDGVTAIHDAIWHDAGVLCERKSRGAHRQPTTKRTIPKPRIDQSTQIIVLNPADVVRLPADIDFATALDAQRKYDEKVSHVSAAGEPQPPPYVESIEPDIITPANTSTNPGKPTCAECKKQYTAATLKKRGGICGRCFKIRESAKPHAKSKKVRISTQIRDAVWRTSMGNVYEAPCPVCLVNMISARNFECGHIIAEAHGGKTEVGNLHPICNICNKSMGVQNLNEFQQSLWAGRESERS